MHPPCVLRQVYTRQHGWDRCALESQDHVYGVPLVDRLSQHSGSTRSADEIALIIGPADPRRSSSTSLVCQSAVAASPASGFVFFHHLLNRVDGFYDSLEGNNRFGEFDGNTDGPVFMQFVAATKAHAESIPDEIEAQDNACDRLLAGIESAVSRGDMTLKMQADSGPNPEDRHGTMVGIFDAHVDDPDNNNETVPVVFLDYASVAVRLGRGWTGSKVRSILKPACVRHPNKNGHRPYLTVSNGRPGGRFNAIAVRRDLYQPEANPEA